jgi:hypothetical protein
MDDILRSAVEVSQQGGAIVFLRERSKKPVSANWTTLPRMTPEQVERRYRDGWNIGLRCGLPSKTSRGLYVCPIDLDISSKERRHVEEAHGWLDRHFPGWRKWPKTISGSGGESRHIWLVTDAELPKAVLAKSKETVEVRGKKKLAWQIEFYSTGAQVVLPPSIHPDTGRRYEWEDGRAPDFDDLPFVGVDHLEDLFDRNGAQKQSRPPHELEPLSVLEEILFDCSAYDNRDGALSYDEWRDVMFAVHAEYFNTELEDAARELALEWSEQSERHSLEWFDHVWETAKDDHERALGLGTLLYRTRHERRDLLHERIENSMRDERDPEEIEEQRRDPEAYAAKKQAEREADWAGKLKVSENGSNTTLAIVENLIAVLEHHPIFKRRLGFCLFNHAVSWRIQPAGAAPPKLDKAEQEALRYFDYIFTKREIARSVSIPYDDKTDYLVIQAVFRTLGLPVFKKPDIDAAVAAVARKRSFNPLEDMLTEQKWDGKARIDQFFQKCLGAEDSPYVRAASECFWTTYALRILHPGAQWDCVFVVCSDQQGIGKSKTFEICATWGQRSFFSDAPFDMSDAKKTGEALQRRLIVEIGEGVALSKYNVADLKACITRTTDRFRPAWGRRTEEVPRMGQMVITQNHDRLPPDNTGNRRYIIIFCGDPGAGFAPGDRPPFAWSWADLVRNLPQLRAEAYERALVILKDCEESGLTPSVTFPKHLAQELQEIQADQTATNRAREWADEVRNFFEEPVAADTLFNTGRVPEKYHGKMVRRLRTTMKEFFYDHLGRPNHEDYLRQSNIDDLTAAFHIYGKCERRKGIKHLGVPSNVWRIKDSSNWLEIVGDEKDFHDDGVRRERGRVIDFVDERDRRDGRRD